MHPLGIAIIGIGILAIVIGVMGSQHAVLGVFKQVPAQAKNAANPSGKK